MSIGLLILLIIVLWLARYVFRAFLAVHNFKRNINEAARRDSQRQGKAPRYDDSQGHYVDFEEVGGPAPDDDNAAPSSAQGGNESRMKDAEFEEIP